MAKVIKPVITAADIDELAALREQIASLSKREKTLKDLIREDAKGETTLYRGEHYSLRVTFVTSERLDTVAAREALGEEWCDSHTKAVVSMNIDALEIL